MTSARDTDLRLSAGYLAPLVAETFPEAVARGGGIPIGISSSLARPSVWRQHATFSMYFVCGVGAVFETWSALFAAGPLGFARLSGNPTAAAAAFAFEGSTFDNVPERVLDVAALLAAVYDPCAGPDSPGRPDREHYLRSGLLDPSDVARIDRGDPYARIKPTKHKDWRALQEYVELPRASVDVAGIVVRFCRMDAIGDRSMRFMNYEVTIDRARYAMNVVCSNIGELACTTPVWPA